jgi:signal transduction histidine kinase
MGLRRIHATVRKISRPALPEREIVEIANRERERLGRELHDGLCQSLAGIAALSAALSRSLAANADPAGSATAAEIAGLLSQTIGQARDLAHGLGPIGRDGADLADALETLVGSTRYLFRVSCTLDCDRFGARLGHDTESHLYRIAQEAVRNAIAHGRADRIDISLTRDVGTGALSIRDNGVGLPEGVRRSGGSGLHTMDYRARAIRGSFEAMRHPPRGTLVTCIFPLHRPRGSREDPGDARDGV